MTARTYNDHWRRLRNTVNSMVNRPDLTPEQVVEHLDTIIACATKMSAQVADLCPEEVQALRAAQIMRVGDDDA